MSDASTQDDLAVVDETNRRFVIHVDGMDAELVYRTQPGRLILVHTEVPDALAGRGLATRLVRFALDRARQTGETVAPWCPFARRWMRTHMDQLDGISVDWSEPPPKAA